MNTIYIVGFMGVGKTTLTTQYAKENTCTFCDLDAYFEHQQQCSISQWIEQYGLDAFRKEEQKLLRNHPNVNLVATGGGIIERQNNLEFLEHQKVLYLSLPFDIIYQRLEKEKYKRPLVISHTKESLFELYEKRKSKYQQVATQTLYLTGHLDQDQVSFQQMIEILKK